MKPEPALSTDQLRANDSAEAKLSLPGVWVQFSLIWVEALGLKGTNVLGVWRATLSMGCRSQASPMDGPKFD